MDVFAICFVIVYILVNVVGIFHLLFRTVDDLDLTLASVLLPMCDIFKGIENAVVRIILIVVYTIFMIPALVVWYIAAVIAFISYFMSYLFRMIFGR
jgi:hypothetical protein